MKYTNKQTKPTRFKGPFMICEHEDEIYIYLYGKLLYKRWNGFQNYGRVFQIHNAGA